MPEIKKAYNEKILKLPLDFILSNQGYIYKKEKCSKNFITMNNSYNDLIVITRQTNGHYLYFNPAELNDKGNIYSFCKNRGIKLQALLGENKLENVELKHNINPSSNLNQKVIESINNYKSFNEVKENNFLITNRLIAQHTLELFNTLKQDKLENICVPTYILDTFSVDKKQFINQNGYMAYLKNPLLKDKDNNAYSKPIKQLCYGNKGLEIIANKESRQSLENIKNIIISESIIDSLSLFELRTYEANETLLCSTNGQITKNHKELLEYFNEKALNAKIILGFDNDEKGEAFTKEVSPIFKDRELIVEQSVLKDFNDDLIVAKMLRLNKIFTAEELENKINKEILHFVDDFLLKKDILYTEAFHKKLNQALSAKKILEYLEPKIKAFIPCEELYRRLSQLKTYEQSLLKGLNNEINRN